MAGKGGRGTGSEEGGGGRFARCGTTRLDPTGNWRAVCAERCKHGSREGPTEKGESTSLAAYSTADSAWHRCQPWICQDGSRQLRGCEKAGSPPKTTRQRATLGGWTPQAHAQRQ